MFETKFSTNDQKFNTEFSNDEQAFNSDFINGGVILGIDGASAYELAVENGFVGTIEEWLVSLKGKDGRDGIDGKDGVDGKNGSNGVSATHSWSGTTLTITSASGTSSANLKGDTGKDGKTPIKGVDYFDGENGKDGYTPVKGTDYFTEADIAEIVNEVTAQFVNGDTEVW